MRSPRWLPEGVDALPTGVIGLKTSGLGGPPPPIGRHHYIFKLYALDRELHLARPTKYLDRVIANAVVLAVAELVGTYQRPSAA